MKPRHLFGVLFLLISLPQFGCFAVRIASETGYMAGKPVGGEIPALATCCAREPDMPHVWFSGYNRVGRGDVFIIFYTSKSQYADSRRTENLKAEWLGKNSVEIVGEYSIQEAPIFASGMSGFFLQSRASYRGLWLQVKRK